MKSGIYLGNKKYGQFSFKLSNAMAQTQEWRNVECAERMSAHISKRKRKCKYNCRKLITKDSNERPVYAWKVQSDV